MAEVVTLDVRTMPPWERHPKIFELFGSLPVGLNFASILFTLDNKTPACY